MKTTRHARKLANNSRIARLARHLRNPDAPVDSATLLRSESLRISAIHGIYTSHVTRRIAWALEVAAAFLDASGAPEKLTRYRRIKNQQPTESA